MEQKHLRYLAVMKILSDFSLGTVVFICSENVRKYVSSLLRKVYFSSSQSWRTSRVFEKAYHKDLSDVIDSGAEIEFVFEHTLRLAAADR